MNKKDERYEESDMLFQKFFKDKEYKDGVGDMKQYLDKMEKKGILLKYRVDYCVEKNRYRPKIVIYFLSMDVIPKYIYNVGKRMDTVIIENLTIIIQYKSIRQTVEKYDKTNEKNKDDSFFGCKRKK